MEKRCILALIVALVTFSGCKRQNDTQTSQTPICEGVIWTLQWTDQSGNSHGMSRASFPESVPGGNGSFNMDLYGRLYITHLEIVNNQQRDLGPRIIPFERIDSIQFGEGGRIFDKTKE